MPYAKKLTKVWCNYRFNSSKKSTWFRISFKGQRSWFSTRRSRPCNFERSCRSYPCNKKWLQLQTNRTYSYLLKKLSKIKGYIRKTLFFLIQSIKCSKSSWGKIRQIIEKICRLVNGIIQKAWYYNWLYRGWFINKICCPSNSWNSIRKFFCRFNEVIHRLRHFIC